MRPTLFRWLTGESTTQDRRSRSPLDHGGGYRYSSTKNGAASHAWAFSGRVVALVLCFFLGQVLAFICLSEP
jgi:hypothetical protein